MDLVTLGAGCFWCVEAIFQQVAGISDISCGYSGGFTENPSYEEVCSESTGHAEVVQFRYNSNIISYEQILEIFWTTHDPTTVNKQGADIGSRYRSVIFYHNKTQKEMAEKLKEKINQNTDFKSDIVTEIKGYENFYIAEDYHQNYFNKNPNVPYCNFVIKPKLEKFLLNE
ncbi:MAG: peptide-methionine (S)-S-oxide reductase [Candidatus Marinimicrobia bacterium]|nr:peptide-methionine (S)-S-oxide reductase [Candidatus Neomarinimicrobiota bacterium]